jgi:predicted DCC family thiol-disulfide oxidoreductase YuxK
VSAATREPLTVFYDGECRLCSGTVAWALARDTAGRLRVLPYQSAEARAMLGEQNAARAARELLVWSPGEGVIGGSDAVAALLRRLPGWRPAGALLGAPPVRWIARPVYRAIAARRGAVRCPLPPLNGARSPTAGERSPDTRR